MENMFTAAEGWGKYCKCLNVHDFKVASKEYRGVICIERASAL